MARRNRRHQNQDLATAITQAFVAILPSVIVQIQHQFVNQQPPNSSPNQNPVNHTHTETPVYDGKAEESTDNQTKTFTTKTFKTALKKTIRKRKGKPHHYAIPVVPFQQIPPVTQLNQKPYTGSAPYCNTCTYHHLPTSVCRFCTHCSKFGHTLSHCRKAKRIEAQINQARDSFNSSGVQFYPPTAYDNSKGISI